jgi:hypothetical protein
MLSCDHQTPAGDPAVDIVYVATNMAHFASWFALPAAPEGYGWQLCFNTGDNQQPILRDQPRIDSGLLVGERSVVILQATPLPTPMG